MRKTGLIYVLAAAMAIAPVTSVSVQAADKALSEVYSVSFDNKSEKYTLKNGAKLSDGRDGKAVYLDGDKQQYVELEKNITANMDGDYSISVDFMPQADTSFARVFDIGSSTDNFMYFTANGGGIPKFRFKNDDLYSSGPLFKVGEWNSAVITKEGREARLYVNGEVAATSSTFMNNLSLLGKTNKNYLGKSQYEHDAYFTGMIDNFRIYNYAIPEGDIKMANNADEVQVKAGFKKDNSEIISFGTKDAITAYADIKNYTKKSVNATLINVLYSATSDIISISKSDKIIINPGDSTSIVSPLLKTRKYPDDKQVCKIDSYIYTDCGSLELISSITIDASSEVASTLPEDTLENTVGVHDPSIFKDPKSGMYYVYSTGMIDIYKSEDLINWTKTINTLPEVPQCVYDMYKHDKKEEYSNIWAPDMFYDESDSETPYHLTCSYSDAFGKNNSSIILFKSASPEGPWENGQIIFTSKADDEELGKVNAIDSNICVDHETGQKYMVYGSFWQGIHIKELNDDGTVKDPSTAGKRIMSRYRGIGGPEGPYIIYNEKTGYYYLFTSYDNLAETYNIRVARSKSITGPYVDAQGNSVDRYDDDESEAKNTYGYKLIGSYQFPFGTTNYGPGHNSILFDGRWYLVHHMRNVKGGYATLNVREMLWNEDGWPVVMPERYQNNRLFECGYTSLCGQWDFISIGDNTNSMLTSQKLILNHDRTAIYGDITGSWSSDAIIPKDKKILIKLGDETITGYVSYAWDSDANCPTLMLTGTNQNNVTKWAKKAISSVVYK